MFCLVKTTFNLSIDQQRLNDPLRKLLVSIHAQQKTLTVHLNFTLNVQVQDGRGTTLKLLRQVVQQLYG